MSGLGHEFVQHDFTCCSGYIQGCPGLQRCHQSRHGLFNCREPRAAHVAAQAELCELVCDTCHGEGESCVCSCHKAPSPAEDEAMRMAREIVRELDDAGPSYEHHTKMGPCPHGRYRGCLECEAAVLADRLRPLLAEAKPPAQAYFRNLIRGLEAEVARLREERDKWRTKWEKLEVTRAVCCNEMEAQRDRLLAGVREALVALRRLQGCTVDAAGSDIVRSADAALRALLGQEGKP